MATQSRLLPGKSHGWRSPVGCSPWGLEESDTTEQLHFHLSLSCIGEGNGNPLQCSCLENPRDGGAWWAASLGSHRVRHDWSNLAAAAAVDEMVGWHHWLNEHECEQTPGDNEGKGNPLQCSCLENPRDGGAWWAAVYGVAQSRTQLKRLSSSSSNVFCHGGSSNLFTLEWILILGMGWPFFTCHASQAMITTEKNPLLWYANCYNIVSHLIAGSISHHW